MGIIDFIGNTVGELTKAFLYLVLIYIVIAIIIISLEKTYKTIKSFVVSVWQKG